MWVRVGSLCVVLSLVGGPAWEFTYTERQKRRHPDLETTDLETTDLETTDLETTDEG